MRIRNFVCIFFILHKQASSRRRAGRETADIEIVRVNGQWVAQVPISKDGANEDDFASKTYPLPANILSIADKAEKRSAALNYVRQLEEEENFMHPSQITLRERLLLKRIWNLLITSASTNETSVSAKHLQEGGHWLDNETDHCLWQGITCAHEMESVLSETSSMRNIPGPAVIELDLSFQDLPGSLPTELGLLSYLRVLSLHNNRLQGTIPSEMRELTDLGVLNLNHNELTGSLPTDFGHYTSGLRVLTLDHNYLTGTIPAITDSWTHLIRWDMSENDLSGSIPENVDTLTHLQELWWGDNLLQGRIPSNMWRMTKLRVIDLGTNLLTGRFPLNMSALTLLHDLNLADNMLSGTIPASSLGMPLLETLILSDNQLSGPLPKGGSDGEAWGRMGKIGTLRLDNNVFNGTLPPQLFHGLASVLGCMDLSYNHFSGSIPTEIGEMSLLHSIDGMSNRLTGTLPMEMLKMGMNLFLNFTDNLLTGRIPPLFCGEGAVTMNILYRQFGCDAVLCRPGTFSPQGHATLHSGCRQCPTTAEGEKQTPPISKILGRTSCPGVEFVHGDLNADGALSPREVLRMIFVDTIGRFWGQEFQSWADMDVHECNLAGITCVKEKVAKIDLTNANLCSGSDGKRGPIHYCEGIPAEIGELTDLEVLQMSRRQFLRGIIPTEIGKLTKLKLFDVSSSSMSGTIPSEIGLLPRLKVLALSHSGFTGTIPQSIFELTSLEKLHLTNNHLTGTIASTIQLFNAKEIIMSRNDLNGTLPVLIGRLGKAENIELYGNNLVGSLPTELGMLSSLKRVDFFNNGLTGTIPEELGNLSNLQILHCKQNNLKGTIPAALGELKGLSWLDLSQNKLHGTIPATLGVGGSLKDLRLAGNMIYSPIPEKLCKSSHINGGMPKKYGCDGILCSLGTYTEMGFATDVHNGCLKCPENQSTLYLGSTKCREFTQEDILAIFFAVVHGNSKDHIANPQDYSLPVCQWSGVGCTADGEIISLSFPLAAKDKGL